MASLILLAQPYIRPVTCKLMKMWLQFGIVFSNDVYFS